MFRLVYKMNYIKHENWNDPLLEKFPNNPSIF